MTLICGLGCSFTINNDFNVFSFGDNCAGHLGFDNKETEIINHPKQILQLVNIKNISCGDAHSVCLDFDGYIYSFGSNKQGQLGLENIKKQIIPQKINNLPPIMQISCGDYFTICLCDKGNIYSFGENQNGQLGLGDNFNVFTPNQITTIHNIIFIECNGNHVICKNNNNEFYSWGYNKYGQLGQGNNIDYNKPIKCNNWPDNIIDIKCGFQHSLLLTSEGNAYSFGNNCFGQLGINDKNCHTLNIPTLIQDLPEIQKISCGYNRCLFIDINYNLWSCGYNSFGQLGVGDTKTKKLPVQSKFLKGIIEISKGGEHSFVRTLDNKIYAFGRNSSSELTDISNGLDIIDPIQVFKDKGDIWGTVIKSRVKSARK